jgi:hypothetical protein
MKELDHNHSFEVCKQSAFQKDLNNILLYQFFGVFNGQLGQKSMAILWTLICSENQYVYFVMTPN